MEPQAPPAMPTAAATQDIRGLRVAAYLIDVLPTLLVGLFGLIPLIGLMIVGFFLLPYWLLRDITGGSLGKLLLGLRVVAATGGPSSAGQRIVRNLPLVVAPGLMMIPLLGYLLAIPAGLIVVVAEAIVLLTQGNHLGDRLAGTTVIKIQ